ncbi:MAG TPA: pantetheine-phosphate adenylyltransferase [Polyangiaceae bacterium]|nr:pantetheine-phosphate adenylyltransferase [Polyangiaceae bacterium]
MRIALYAGSFDPVTLGHLSVIRRASELFDRLWVVIGENPTKTPYFSLEERLAFLRDASAGCPNVEVSFTRGFVVDYAKELGARVLVRGVRGATDADYEAELAAANRSLAPAIHTVFLPADPELSKLSSSRLKELASRGMDVSAYTTPLVASALVAAFGQEKSSHV